MFQPSLLIQHHGSAQIRRDALRGDAKSSQPFQYVFLRSRMNLDPLAQWLSQKQLDNGKDNGEERRGVADVEGTHADRQTTLHALGVASDQLTIELRKLSVMGEQKQDDAPLLRGLVLEGGVNCIPESPYHRLAGILGLVELGRVAQDDPTTFGVGMLRTLDEGHFERYFVAPEGAVESQGKEGPILTKHLHALVPVLDQPCRGQGDVEHLAPQKEEEMTIVDQLGGTSLLGLQPVGLGFVGYAIDLLLEPLQCIRYQFLGLHRMLLAVGIRVFVFYFRHLGFCLWRSRLV